MHTGKKFSLLNLISSPWKCRERNPQGRDGLWTRVLCKTNQKICIYRVDWQFQQPPPWQGELKEEAWRKSKKKEEKEHQIKTQLEGRGKSRGMVIYLFISKMLICSILTHLATKQHGLPEIYVMVLTFWVLTFLFFWRDIQIFLSIWSLSCLEDWLISSNAVISANLMYSISYSRVFQWCTNRSRPEVNQ